MLKLKSPFFCITLTFTSKPGELIAIKCYFTTNNYKWVAAYTLCISTALHSVYESGKGLCLTSGTPGGNCIKYKQKILAFRNRLCWRMYLQQLQFPGCSVNAWRSHIKYSEYHTNFFARIINTSELLRERLLKRHKALIFIIPIRT